MQQKERWVQQKVQFYVILILLITLLCFFMAWGTNRKDPGELSPLNPESVVHLKP